MEAGQSGGGATHETKHTVTMREGRVSSFTSSDQSVGPSFINNSNTVLKAKKGA